MNEEILAIEITPMPDGHYAYRTEGETESAASIVKYEFLE